MSQLSPSMTLGEFWRAYVLPIHRVGKQADRKTIQLDEAALNHWESLSSNPPLAEITEYHMADFVAALMQQPGRGGKTMNPNTVRKHLAHLQFALDRAGPRDHRKMRNAAQLIPLPPAFELPKPRQRKSPMILSLDEIARWIDACSTTVVPEPEAPVWWRALVIFTYNTGLRIDCVMRLEWSMLRSDGWLDVPAEIYKGHEHGGEFYVNKAARAAIRPLKSLGTDRIFPWTSWPASESWLQEQRRRQWVAAKIKQPGNGFHGLRRTLLTWLSGRNDLIARMVAGHAAGGDMLHGHYASKRSIIPELLEQVPQPRLS
jgi:integrase